MAIKILVRVSLTDHDWEIESKRTLQVTTYQFVEVVELKTQAELFTAIVNTVGTKE